VTSTKGAKIVGEQRRLRQGITILMPDFEAAHACGQMACERRYSRTSPMAFDMLEVGKQGHACNRQRDFEMMGEVVIGDSGHGLKEQRKNVSSIRIVYSNVLSSHGHHQDVRKLL
jgi:hypothetical protein